MLFRSFHPTNSPVPNSLMDQMLEGTNLYGRTINWYELGYILKMESTTQDKKDEEKKVNVPDWWLKLEQINKGYGYVLKNYPSYITAFQENDIKFLELFKKHGLITDSTEPCTIVGNYQFILDFLYLNQSDLNQALQAKSSFKFEDDDPVKQILENPSYRNDLIQIKYKHKNNSSFEEQVNLDELAFEGFLENQKAEVFGNVLNASKQIGRAHV